MKLWRWLMGGTWYYCRPYDNLYSFTHMRYWISRRPLYNEVILAEEHYGKWFCKHIWEHGEGNKTCVKCQRREDVYMGWV